MGLRKSELMPWEVGMKNGERTERLDMRLTKAEKKKLQRAAIANECTITAIVAGLIAEMK
jgi:hypothetical protein